MTLAIIAFYTGVATGFLIAAFFGGVKKVNRDK